MRGVETVSSEGGGGGGVGGVGGEVKYPYTSVFNTGGGGGGSRK